MVRFTLNELRSAMKCTGNIRNVAVVGPHEHGKTTLYEAFAPHSIVVVDEELKNAKGVVPDVCPRVTTYKANQGMLLHTVTDEEAQSAAEIRFMEPSNSTHEGSQESAQESDQIGRLSNDDGTAHWRKDFLINMIDTPSYREYTMEYTASLGLVDGAILVIDCNSRFGIQHEAYIAELSANEIPYLLFFNKFDQALFDERIFDGEESLYTLIMENLLDFNRDLNNRQKVDPVLGNVVFGSASQGWGLCLWQFEEMYSDRMGVPVDEMIGKLWGDHYFNPVSKTWGEKTEWCLRGFNSFVLAPIMKVMDACLSDAHGTQKLAKMAQKLGIETIAAQTNAQETYNAFMRKWLPLDRCLLGKICIRLPSPITSQRNRANLIGVPPAGDIVKQPLIVYVSHHLQSNLTGRLYAVGRVFAGTAKAGDRVWISDANGGNACQREIEKVSVLVGQYVEDIGEVPAGNLIAIPGFDRIITGEATISKEPARRVYRNRQIPSPVVRATIAPEHPQDLSALEEVLRSAVQMDPTFQYRKSKNEGQFMIYGAGIIHLQRSLLGRTLYRRSSVIPCIRAEPTMKCEPSVAVSSNGLCRITVAAGPTSEEHEVQKLPNLWREFEGNRLLANIGLDGLESARNAIIGAFVEVLEDGFLCDATLRNLNVTLEDITIGEDFKGGKRKIAVLAGKAIREAILASGLRLVQPFYRIEVQGIRGRHIQIIHEDIIRARGGRITYGCIPEVGPTITRGELPVVETLHDFLGMICNREVSACLIHGIDDWECVPGDPLSPGTPAHVLVERIREEQTRFLTTNS